MSRAEELDTLSGLAHDLANVLVGVVGNLELADQSVGVSPMAREHLARARSATFLAAGLARQLVRSASDASLRTLDLNAACEEMAQLVDVSTPRSTRIVLSTHPEPLRVQTPPRALRRIVLNLVTNASEALPNSRGEVVVRTDRTADRAVLEVRDDGRGIPRELLPRVFERHVTTKHEGGGLGLNAVLELVEALGGTVHLASEVGRGTLATVTLPLAT